MESSAESNCEVRALIKFLNAKGVTGSENHRRLSNVNGAGNVMSLCHIYKWIEHFNAEWSDTHDEQQTGHLRDSINTMKRLLVCALYSLKIIGSQFQTFTERWQSVTEHRLPTQQSFAF